MQKLTELCSVKWNDPIFQSLCGAVDFLGFPNGMRTGYVVHMLSKLE
jgi:hypothetical protein